MKTAQEMAAALLDDVTIIVATTEAKMADWKQLFAEHPFYAMSWQQNPSALVCKHKVYMEIKYALEAALDPEKAATPQGVCTRLLEEGTEQVIRYAKSAGNRSTSTLSNLQEEFYAGTWADIIDSYSFGGGVGTQLKKIAQMDRITGVGIPS